MEFVRDRIDKFFDKSTYLQGFLSFHFFGVSIDYIFTSDLME